MTISRHVDYGMLEGRSDFHWVFIHFLANLDQEGSAFYVALGMISSMHWV